MLLTMSIKLKLIQKVRLLVKKLRKIPLSQVKKVNAEIDKMLEADIIEEA